MDLSWTLYRTTTLHPRYARRTPKPLHWLLRRMAATWRPCLALTLSLSLSLLTRLRHVHGRACVCACNMGTWGAHMRARLCDTRAATIAELCMRRTGRLVLPLSLRKLRLLLLRRLLQAHLLHLALTHQLSIVGLVVSSLLRRTLLWLLLLGMLLRLRLRLVLCALLGATNVSIGAIRHSPVGLISRLILLVCRRTVTSILLLRIAYPSGGVHCILTHLTR